MQGNQFDVGNICAKSNNASTKGRHWESRRAKLHNRGDCKREESALMFGIAGKQSRVSGSPRPQPGLRAPQC